MMVADAMMGLALAGTLLTAVAVTGGYHLRATRAAERQHQRLTAAELTLLSLQQGEPTPDLSTLITQPPPNITVLPLDTPEPGPGGRWVKVTARDDEGVATLIGLIPMDALAREEAEHD